MEVATLHFVQIFLVGMVPRPPPPPWLETEIFGAKTTGMSWAGLVVVILLAAKGQLISKANSKLFI